MSAKVKYANLHSRILLRRAFERQFVIPLFPPPRVIERILKWYEMVFLKVDTGDIEIDRPIFLIGLPRSGTTMLQDILCSHPHLAYFTNTMHQFRSCFCAAEDLRKRFRLDFKGERYLCDGIEIGLGTANEGHGFLADWRGIDPYSLEPVELQGKQLSRGETERVRATIRKVIWCFGGHGRRFFLKNPILLQYLNVLKDLFPDARIVHLVRDPRTCANSMVKLYRLNRAQEIKLRALKDPENHDLLVPYPRLPKLKEYIGRFGPDDLRTTAHVWNDAISIVGRDKVQVNFFYEVRYEDILANPRKEILRILEFSGLSEADAKGGDFAEKISRVGHISHVNHYGNFGLVEEICRSNMQKYDYL